MSVGVVLGAGGPIGWAYHLGVLEGVRDAIGREPAAADRIVGTSAGAAIAATLLTGTPTDDVLELISARPAPKIRNEYGLPAPEPSGIRFDHCDHSPRAWPATSAGSG